jgi:integrase
VADSGESNEVKMREPHIVPLSRQAVALLRDLHPLTGAGRYLFPSLRGKGAPRIHPDNGRCLSGTQG